ncbi:unnamed protein product [Cladocopium goreaui]|uniref:Uncharacterized protein n=1 Tax=Cladocopium goreaui TaxID=2562237 RepID=A0A9P1CCD7_9DINO|nr:unnamed protein product [Cladocopium goreaui]
MYRIQPNTLNGRAVYKKDRSEAYLLYTTLRDWMFSGRPDAGGQRCEGWAWGAPDMRRELFTIKKGQLHVVI